jgi:NAD(P)-dependent dehydrogenase (short-subunit alcohol dehydrogenase family)
MAMVLCNYTNRRVIVSGCSSGIGAATARLLRQLGAKVHGLDRRAPDLDLESFEALDLREPASIDSAVNRLGGRVDALFNCAGLAPGHPPLDIVKVNFLGTRYLTQRTLPLIGDGGAIVSIASNGGMAWRHHVADLLQLVDMESFDGAVEYLGKRLSLISNAYSFSKEALIVWTMRQSSLLVRRGIRINCTSPGAVQTPMLEEIEKIVPSAAIDAVAQPIGRRSTPEEQAWPLVLLNSEAASYINGVDLPVDGGFAAAAALEDLV